MLEEVQEKIDFTDGVLPIIGANRGIGFGKVAYKGHVPHDYSIDRFKPGLEEIAF